MQSGDVLAIIKACANTTVTAERIRVIVQPFYDHAIRICRTGLGAGRWNVRLPPSRSVWAHCAASTFR